MHLWFPHVRPFLIVRPMVTPLHSQLRRGQGGQPLRPPGGDCPGLGWSDSVHGHLLLGTRYIPSENKQDLSNHVGCMSWEQVVPAVSCWLGPSFILEGREGHGPDVPLEVSLPAPDTPLPPFSLTICLLEAQPCGPDLLERPSAQVSAREPHVSIRALATRAH